MPTADDIRDGIATALASTGIRVVKREGVQVNPPAFKVGLPRPLTRDTLDGTWVWGVELRLLVQSSSLAAADTTLAPLIGTDSSSVIGLLYAANTLGGVCSDLVIEDGVSEIGLADIDGTTHAFASWVIEVWV